MKPLLIMVVACSMARSSVQQRIAAEGPDCPYDDPLTTEAGSFNISAKPFIRMPRADVFNLTAVGLSTFSYKIDLVGLDVNFEVSIENFSGQAIYIMEGSTDATPFRQQSIPSGDFSGSGLGKLAVGNGRARGASTIFFDLQQKVQLSRFVINEAVFDVFQLDLGPAFNIRGDPVDWTDFNRNVKANFDRDLASNKEAIQEKIRLAANDILKKFTLAELVALIEGGDEDCEG